MSPDERENRRRADGISSEARFGGSVGKLISGTSAYFQHVFGLDLRSLALFRIGLGLILLVDLWIRAGDLRAFYTDWGTYPRYLMSDVGWSFHAACGEFWWPAVLMIAASALALALLLGFFTRVAIIGCWLLLLSIQMRNTSILQGGDILLRLLVFWGIFLPLGKRWSIDRAWTRRERRSEIPNLPHDTPATICSIATACLILQICFMYWFGVVLKSDPMWRVDGTAVYVALSLEQFTTPLGKVLLDYPALLRRMTFATLYLEAVGPCLLFVPVFTHQIRTLVVFAFLLFHLFGLNLTMELGLFPYICGIAWIALLPGEYWSSAASMKRRLSPIRILSLSKKKSESTQPASAARRQIAVSDSREAPTSSTWLPTVSQGWRWKRVRDAFLVLLLLYAFLWNLRTIDFKRFEKIFPRSLNFVGETLGLGQYWIMFAPYPMKETGWYVIEGTLRDGTKVDLMAADGRPPSFEEPELISATFPNQRWRKYLVTLWEHPNNPGSNTGPLRQHFVEYLKRKWNASHHGVKTLKRVDFYFVWREIKPDGQHLQAERLKDRLWPIEGIQ